MVQFFIIISEFADGVCIMNRKNNYDNNRRVGIKVVLCAHVQWFGYVSVHSNGNVFTVIGNCLDHV